MKEAKFSKEAQIIYNELDGRIAHLWEKLTSGNYNGATQYAFEIGALSDIEEGLKKIEKRKRRKKK